MTTDGIQVVETADVEEAIRERGDRPLPAALPVLPLKEMVAYPDTLTPLAVGQERSVKLIDDVLSGERTLVLVASRDPEIEEPGPDQLYDVGVAGVVARMIKVPDGTLRILVHGAQRVLVRVSKCSQAPWATFRGTASSRIKHRSHGSAACSANRAA